MSLLAIVERPNVGKSTLFNCLVGMRQAIVDETAGGTETDTTADASGVVMNFQ